MKRLIAVVLLLLMLVPSAYAQGETITFAEEDYYRTQKPFSNLPSTFEATVRFPADFAKDQVGGIILGNFQYKTVPGFSFSITEGGAPYLTICDNEKQYHSYTFDEICVYTGEWVRIILTKDSAADTLCCYVDGQLKQTLYAASPASVEMNLALCLGADQRSMNSKFFKGEIQSAALYQEPVSQETVHTFWDKPLQMEGMMAGYDLSQPLKNGMISDLSENGFDLAMEHRFFTEKEPVEDYAYSFAVLGDPQYMTRTYEESLYRMFEWVGDQAESKKIQRVIMLGDMTHRDSDGEWSSFKICVDDLPIPFSLVRGNHDGTARFNKNFSFEDYGETVDGTYDGTLLNAYKCFKAGKVPYLILTLDYCPSDEVLEWANEVVASHPKDNVIVVTHNYIKGAGGLSSNITVEQPAEEDDENSESTVAEPSVGNGGKGIFEKLVRKHKNITMVLCGHTYDVDANIVEQVEGDHGNTITQMRINAQRIERVLEGVGIVTMFYFSKDGTKLQVENYSTTKEAYFLKENQYTVELDLLDPPSVSPILVVGLSAVLLLGVVSVLLFLKKKKQI